MRTRASFLGHVQGVGFRATARSICRRHNLVGWVRNEDDGSVLMEVQGDAMDVQAALDELRTSMGSRIARVELSSLPERLDELEFEIAR